MGYTEPAKAFTCDGNPNGENVYNNVYRITSKVLDLTTVTSFTFVNGGQSITMTKEEFIGMGGQVTSEDIGADDMGWLAYTIPTDGDKPIGTYVWCDENGYVSRIEFADTVHRIDGKYLPEGGVGYTDSGKMIFSAELTAAVGGEGSMYQNTEKLVLVDGQKYIVQTDSGSFESKCTYHPPIEGDNESYWVLGDGSVFNSVFGATDHPFAIMVATDGEQWLVVCGDKNGGSHMTISEADIVHKIDPKYIYGVPVVELTSSPTVEGVTLTEAESVMLTAAANTFLPVAVRFFDAAEQCNIGVVFNNVHGFQLTASISGADFVLLNQGGNWVFGVSTTS